jgi:hypothetical protein
VAIRVHVTFFCCLPPLHRNTALYAKKYGLKTLKCNFKQKSSAGKKRQRRRLISFQSSRIKYMNARLKADRTARGQKQTVGEFKAARRAYAQAFDDLGADERQAWLDENTRVARQKALAL